MLAVALFILSGPREVSLVEDLHNRCIAVFVRCLTSSDYQVSCLKITCMSQNHHLNLPRPAPIWPCSSVVRETVICSASLTCSFTTNYYLNYPRPAPIWPCSSVGRATVICSGGHVFESEIFSLSPCGLFFFLVLSLRRYHLRYLYSTSTYHI